MKIGDRVIVVNGSRYSGFDGEIGVVRGLPVQDRKEPWADYSKAFAVEFEETIHGHECGGVLSNRCGQFIFPEDLKLDEATNVARILESYGD